jgi:hypothetical protein
MMEGASISETSGNSYQATRTSQSPSNQKKVKKQLKRKENGSQKDA